MNEYIKNRNVMAHTLARVIESSVDLDEDDSINIFEQSDAVKALVLESMKAEYRNEIEIDPLMVRTIGLAQSYNNALLREFDLCISYDCEEWLRNFKKDREE